MTSAKTVLLAAFGFLFYVHLFVSWSQTHHTVYHSKSKHEHESNGKINVKKAMKENAIKIKYYLFACIFLSKYKMYMEEPLRVYSVLIYLYMYCTYLFILYYCIILLLHVYVMHVQWV